MTESNIVPFEDIENLFAPQIRASFDEVKTATANLEVANYANSKATLIAYASGNITQYTDEYIKPDDFLARQKFCQDFVVELDRLIEETFFVEVRADDLEELFKIYELFVTQRFTTISKILLYYVVEKFGYEVIDNTEEASSLAVELLNKIEDTIDLTEAFDDWYLERCKEFHDNIFFETARQNFFEVFTYQEGMNIAEIVANPVVINSVKSQIIYGRVWINNQKLKEEING